MRRRGTVTTSSASCPKRMGNSWRLTAAEDEAAAAEETAEAEWQSEAAAGDCDNSERSLSEGEGELMCVAVRELRASEGWKELLRCA